MFWRKSFEVYDIDSPVGVVWLFKFYYGIEISHKPFHTGAACVKILKYYFNIFREQYISAVIPFPVPYRVHVNEIPFASA